MVSTVQSLPRRIMAVAADSIFWRVLKKSDQLRLAREFKREQWDSVTEFTARQDRLLAGLLVHAKNRVPFYSRQIGFLSDEDILNDPRSALYEFPLLTREKLRTELDDLWTEMERGTYRNSTGGSTGVPVTFYQDHTYLDAALAVTRLFYSWAGLRPGERLLRLWGARRDMARGPRELPRKILESATNTRTLGAFSMSPDDMREYCTTISTFRPVAIEGYADSLYELARYVDGESVSVPAPRCIIASAGTLYPHMRTLISCAFGAPVFDRYGSREAGNVAAECGTGQGLHVHGETSLVEVVDSQDREVGRGETGRLLITNLWNYTMPFIRYEIGDDATRGGDECPCGRPYPLLERLTGRSGASFRTEKGGVVVPEFFIHVIGVEFRDLGIRKFQVIQERVDLLVVKIVMDATDGQEPRRIVEPLADRIRQEMGPGCRVDLEFVADIPPTPTGKHLYTISRLPRRSKADL